MKIGLRTIKTALSAAIGIWLASTLHLLYPTAAGIIALLSVTNTKRSSFQVGFYRLCSLALATVIAFICFNVIGYTALAFGLYILIFIPLAVKWKLSDGIPVSSVLVTHYLIEKSVSWTLVGNAFSLMIIGVGLALVFNLYMPNLDLRVREDQQKIEMNIRILLREMAESLTLDAKRLTCENLIEELMIAVDEGRNWASTHAENHLLSQDIYYLDYFNMRRVQIQMLQKMNQLVQEIIVEPGQAEGIKKLFIETAENFSEENDGRLIAAQIETVYENYRQAPLPQTRAEFENRARLYQLLNDFKLFIEIKVSFSNERFFKL